jgi:hypothetical protein
MHHGRIGVYHSSLWRYLRHQYDKDTLEVVGKLKAPLLTLNVLPIICNATMIRNAKL